MPERARSQTIDDGGEAYGGVPADALPGAGDDRDLAFQPAHLFDTNPNKFESGFFGSDQSHCSRGRADGTGQTQRRTREQEGAALDLA